MQNATTIEMNSVNQNENAQIVGNALSAFKARFNLQAKVRKQKELLELTSVENGCQHLRNKVKAIRKNITSSKEFKNTNLISLNDGVYTTSLYLGKAVISLNDEQLVGEFDNAEDAIQMILNYVELVEAEHSEFVQSMTNAIAKIATYEKTDRSTKRSNQQS